MRYERLNGHYELIEPQRANSYDLGDQWAAQAYFERVGMEYLGQRAMNSARNFGASQALIKDQRAFGLDLCKVNLDDSVLRKELERELFHECEEQEPEEHIF